MHGPDFSSLKSFQHEDPKKGQTLKKIKEIDSQEEEEDDKNAYIPNQTNKKTDNLINDQMAFQKKEEINNFLIKSSEYSEQLQIIKEAKKNSKENLFINKNKNEAYPKNMNNIKEILENEINNSIESKNHEYVSNNSNPPSNIMKVDNLTEQETDRRDEGLIQPKENFDKDLNKIDSNKITTNNEIYITPNQNQIDVDPIFEELADKNTTLERKKIIVNTPVPLSSSPLLLTINRVKQFLHGVKYELRFSEGGSFILKAKKIKGAKSHYTINLNESNLTQEGPDYVGKVSSNIAKTRYNVFGPGQQFSKAKNENEIRSQQCCILFDKIRKTKDYKGFTPRTFKVIIPKLDENGNPYVIKPHKKEEMFTKMASAMDTDKIFLLVSVPPRWDAVREIFVMDFQGRVTQTSIKNCQISFTPEGEKILFQFGKVAPDSFNLDVNHPFSIFQAFSIALSLFDL